jgi:predicted nucleotidyltransferase
LYTQTLAPQTLGLIQTLQAEPLLQGFHLVGGTALALQIGHRISIDIDLFTRNDYDIDLAEWPRLIREPDLKFDHVKKRIIDAVKPRNAPNFSPPENTPMPKQDNSNHPDILQTVASALAHEAGLKVALVYGSAAAGTMRRDSDVDVAVLFDGPLGMDARLALWGRLTDALRREIDLVDLYDLGGEILHQVLTKGCVVVKNDEQAYYRLLQRMVYNAEDFMPQVRQVLRQRVERFAYG